VKTFSEKAISAVFEIDIKEIGEEQREENERERGYEPHPAQRIDCNDYRFVVF